jgi:hypothetical protein
MSPIADVFALLDKWRHLPAYQLERRADVFFALYLREVVEQHVGQTLHDVVIPELPLRRGTLWGESSEGANLSVKVDYALAAADGRTFYLVELKTDDDSRREGQDRYLERAAEIGLHAIVDGIVRAAAHSQSLQKYFYLFRELGQLGLLEVPDSLYDLVFPEVRRGVRRHLGQIRNLVPTPEPKVHVLYIQPHSEPGHDCIDFEEFARIAEAHGDELSTELAAALRRWTAKAGAERPTSHTE